MKISARLLSLTLPLSLTFTGCRTLEPAASGHIAVQGETCAACHAGALAASGFDHTSVGYGMDCDACHGETDWAPTRRDPHPGFPLADAHAELSCGDCHAPNRPDPQPTACLGCHAIDRDAARPSHAPMPEACLDCHTAKAWRPVTYDHAETWPLTGSHQVAGCGDCHKNREFAGTVRVCLGCHADDRQRARPDHAGLPERCESCHSTTAWSPADLNHDPYWRLNGAHATADCAGCHPGGRYSNTPRDCASCHRDQRPAQPDHSDFAETCESCHSTTAWRPAALDHDRFFPLTGLHVGADCAACHPGGRYEGTPDTCRACHAQDAARAALPHDGFPPDCAQCHSTAGWAGATFDHDLVYALEGRHVQLPCASCHADDRFHGTPRTCLGCHADDRAAARPDHTGFPERCTACHNQDAWMPGLLNHDQFWPLAGQHAIADCNACHLGGRFAGTPRDCVGCHRADAAAVVAPRHTDFPDSCLDCHTDAAWRPAAVDHDRYWVLDGAHALADCVDCHAGGHFAGTPRTCIGCHAADKATALPTHVRLSDVCTPCHTQTAWRPATFRHRFPVPHRGSAACIDCHRNPRDYGAYACTTCHEHSRGNTDPHHNEVANYAYTDAGCVRCHPTGRAD